MSPFIIPIVAIIAVFGVAPAMVFGFILLNRKLKADVEKQRLQHETAKIQLEQKRLELQLMQEENHQLDLLIESGHTLQRDHFSLSRKN